MQKRIVIAGTGSGVGKTTLTIGIMAALKRKGYTVQGFKCGPDYIDPSYHTAITGSTSRNLDSWMCTHETVKEIFVHGCEDADISVIEGMMGLFDGRDPKSNVGSTAEISHILNCPVLLIVDCQSMARSAAAIVKGFQNFSDTTKIAGVIANRVGSEGHFQLIKEAIETECQIPVIGYMLRDDEITIPERHLGLVPSIERGELDNFFVRLADSVLQTVDIDRLLQISDVVPLPIEKPTLFRLQREKPRVRIAVMRDQAFDFYYPENIELLEEFGAECVYFSPLKGETVPPNIQGLYMGGGFPEEFAETLSHNHEVKQSIQRAIAAGIPTLAECGGFMYLCDELITSDQKAYKMVGLIPGTITMHTRLQALGYREIRGHHRTFLLGPSDVARGHEFHYSSFQPCQPFTPAYEIQSLRGSAKEGYTSGNLVAGYTHFHFASNLDLPRRWIEVCQEVFG